jgi:hypothetical protein
MFPSTPSVPKAAVNRGIVLPRSAVKRSPALASASPRTPVSAGTAAAESTPERFVKRLNQWVAGERQQTGLVKTLQSAHSRSGSAPAWRSQIHQEIAAADRDMQAAARAVLDAQRDDSRLAASETELLDDDVKDVEEEDVRSTAMVQFESVMDDAATKAVAEIVDVRQRLGAQAQLLRAHLAQHVEASTARAARVAHSDDEAEPAAPAAAAAAATAAVEDGAADRGKAEEEDDDDENEQFFEADDDWDEVDPHATSVIETKPRPLRTRF